MNLTVDSGKATWSGRPARIENKCTSLGPADPFRLCAVGDLALGKSKDANEVPKFRGTLFGGPNNEDHSILGSILGSPYFGKLPNSVIAGFRLTI